MCDCCSLSDHLRAEAMRKVRDKRLGMSGLRQGAQRCFNGLILAGNLQIVSNSNVHAAGLLALSTGERRGSVISGIETS